MKYSDLYVTDYLKVEILPNDRFNVLHDVIAPGDKLVCVFRPVQSDYMADKLHRGFVDELVTNAAIHSSVEEAIVESINAHNISALSFLGNPELAPKSGAMLVVLYVSRKNKTTFVQLGNISVKAKDIALEQYKTISENHTFSNNLEKQYLTNSKLLNDIEMDDIDRVIYQIGLSIRTLSNGTGVTVNEVLSIIPSRFIGHPDWCGWGGENGMGLINTQPFIFQYDYDSSA